MNLGRRLEQTPQVTLIQELVGIAIDAIGKCGTRVTSWKLYFAASRNVAYALSATSAEISRQRAAA